MLKTNFRRLIIVCMCALVTLAASACSIIERPSESGAGHVINTAAPSGSSGSENIEPPNAEEALKALFFDCFDEDLFLINVYNLPSGYSSAATIIASKERYTLKEDLLPKLIENALEDMCKTDDYADRSYDLSGIEYPSWQYLSAVMPYTESEQEFFDVLGLEVSDSGKTLTVSLTPMPIVEFAKSKAEAAPDEEAANVYMDIRFTYGYMTAVYDENTNEDIKQSYTYPEGYTDTLQFPLAESPPEFHNTWAQGRSNNTRQHMGTDIKMPEGTEILSCSSGTVVYTGTDTIPGNYVIILDDYGFEYHYYHMVTLTTHVKWGDKVECGDVIGNVGNTGNSDANHLHIAIIAPDGSFINPFGLMNELKDRG